MNWILARLREPSTWRGVAWLLTALGVSLSPDAWAHITTAGMAVAGLIGVLSREDEIQLPPIDLVGQSQAVRPEGDAGLRPGDGDTHPDRLPQSPMRHVDYPVRHNTDESADIGNDFPGWGS